MKTHFGAARKQWLGAMSERREGIVQP